MFVDLVVGLVVMVFFGCMVEVIVFVGVFVFVVGVLEVCMLSFGCCEFVVFW